MISAPLPEDEEQRLAALRRYQILDTPSERTFDDIVQLASDLCQTPIALISLVDEYRQWFKARVGIDATETHRDLSLCAHAIHGTQLFEIPDAHLDERFADHPNVEGEPYVRFYAGAPLITSDGHALGTLCVVDYEPRTLTPLQQRALRVLGEQAVTQMDLRLKMAEIAQAAARSMEMQKALAAANEQLRARVTVIERQQAVIDSLESPMIEVWDRVLCAPLAGVVDQDRASAIIETMLAQITQVGARYAILDLTGVEFVDAATAHHLMQLTRAINLLGSRALVTGIRPSVAKAITNLSFSLPRGYVFRTLRQALEYCISRQSSDR